MKLDERRERCVLRKQKIQRRLREVNVLRYESLRRQDEARNGNQRTAVDLSIVMDRLDEMEDRLHRLEERLLEKAPKRKATA